MAKKCQIIVTFLSLYRNIGCENRSCDKSLKEDVFVNLPKLNNCCQHEWEQSVESNFRLEKKQNSRKK